MVSIDCTNQESLLLFKLQQQQQYTVATSHRLPPPRPPTGQGGGARLTIVARILAPLLLATREKHDGTGLIAAMAADL